MSLLNYIKKIWTKDNPKLTNTSLYKEEIIQDCSKCGTKIVRHTIPVNEKS